MLTKVLCDNKNCVSNGKDKQGMNHCEMDEVELVVCSDIIGADPNQVYCMSFEEK